MSETYGILEDIEDNLKGCALGIHNQIYNQWWGGQPKENEELFTECLALEMYWLEWKEFLTPPEKE